MNLTPSLWVISSLWVFPIKAQTTCSHLLNSLNFWPTESVNIIKWKCNLNENHLDSTHSTRVAIIKNTDEAWVWSSVAEHLTSMYKALGFISSTERKKKVVMRTWRNWNLLWFGYEVSPPKKNSYVEGLVTKAFRGGASGKWLNHGVANLINGLIHWWIHKWMNYWEVVETVEGETWLEEVGHAFEGYILSLSPSSVSLSLISSHMWWVTCCVTRSCSHDVLPYHRPRNKLTMDWAHDQNKPFLL
jgi:hypothetical protein